MRFYYKLALTLCVLIIAAPIVSAVDVELVTNGDFELWTVNGAGGPPDDWAITSDSTTATQETSTIHGGASSVNLTWISQTQGNQNFQSNSFPVYGDSAYVCSLWVYDNDPAGRIRMSMVTDAGNLYGGYSSDFAGWQLMVYTDTVASSATVAFFQIRLYDVSGDWDGDATAYVDDLTLWGPEPPSGNIPPAISQVYRDPYPTVLPTDFVTVNANVSDIDGVIVTDSMYIQVDAGGYGPVSKDSIGTNGKFYYSIGMNTAGAFVEYYVVATDDSSARTESGVESYTVTDPVPTTLEIAEIEFNNTVPGTPDSCYNSPYAGSIVTFSGIVTRRYEHPDRHDRYFLQDADSVWSGVYVYNAYSGDTVSVGDSVTVTASVDEYFGLTEIATITSQVINSAGNPLPAPIVLTCADLGSQGCDAAAEAYEGVYIQINNLIVTSAGDHYDFWANDGSGDSCLISTDLYYGAPSQPNLQIGDVYNFIRGVGTYAYGQYKIGPASEADAVLLTVTPIAEIQFNNTVQGTSPDCYNSPIADSIVTFGGIVTARYEHPDRHDRYFLQDADTVWSGVYVYNGYSGDTVSIGDNVTVTATVDEYYGLTEIVSITSQAINSAGNSLPAPIVLTCADLGSQGCDADAEAYEGVYIQINNLVVTSTGDHYDFWANDGSGDSCLIMTDLYFNGASQPNPQIGDTCQFVRGVCSYAYDQYKIAPRFSADYSLAGSGPVCSSGNIFNIQFPSVPGADTSSCWPSDSAGTQVEFCGVVTAVAQGTQPRIYLQDQDNQNYGGIFFYDYTLDNGDSTFYDLGDYLEVTGWITEYHGWTEVDTVNTASVLATGEALPETLVVTVNDLAVGCGFSTEGYESILVRLNTVTVLSFNNTNEYWITDTSTGDSIRIDDDLWAFGGDQPTPQPSTGATYDWIIGVMKWEGRQGGTGEVRGWVLLPRFASDYESLIIPEPEIIEVWSVDNTTLRARFDREMDAATTENSANYSTTGGLSISAAVLDVSERIVTLTTSTQPDNTVDSLVTVNVCDTTGICVTGTLNNLYHSGITEIATIQTPGLDGDTSQIYQHIVTVKAVVSCDSSQAYYNTAFVQDASGPPYNGVQLYASGGDFGWNIVVGDTVILTGRVDEYFGATELTDLLDFDNRQFVNSGPQPDPAEVTAADLADLATGEEYEGVLITVCDTLIVVADAPALYGFIVKSTTSPTDSFVVFDRFTAGHTRYTYVPAVDDIITGITGPLRWTYDYFRLHPRSDADFNTIGTYCPGRCCYESPLVVECADNSEAECTALSGTWVAGLNCIDDPCPEGCEYTIGDVNGSDSYNGLDITYGVAFFKGGPDPLCDPCPIAPCDAFHYCGDVNGSCSYNGLDITYGVAYFKGGPGPIPCADCPPVGGPASSLKGNDINPDEFKPVTQPNLDSKSKSKKGADLIR